MNSFISVYEYHIAWAAYVVSGLFFCVFWWKLTAKVRHAGWRDLLRGVAVVMMYVPWYVSDAREHLAPAIVVIVMDLLIGSTDNGLTGMLVLLVASALMLAVLIGKRLLGRRDGTGRSSQ